MAATGAGAVGAYDDLYGSTQAKGFRGHLRALAVGHRHQRDDQDRRRRCERARGQPDHRLPATPQALVAAWPRGVLDTALIAGTASLTNLFDLRPGRAAKVVPAAGRRARSVSGSAPYVGAAAGCLPADLGERAMLGDCGANALGAGIGAVAAARLPMATKIVALLAVIALTAASERVSFTAVIEATPALRWLDRLGRR